MYCLYMVLTQSTKLRNRIDMIIILKLGFECKVHKVCYLSLNQLFLVHTSENNYCCLCHMMQMFSVSYTWAVNSSQTTSNISTERMSSNCHMIWSIIPCDSNALHYICLCFKTNFPCPIFLSAFCLLQISSKTSSHSCKMYIYLKFIPLSFWPKWLHM